jgi:hypothetical protein
MEESINKENDIAAIKRKLTKNLPSKKQVRNRPNLLTGN